MNLNDLKQAVIHLGFDTEIESDEAFILTLNRALLEVNDISPKRGIFRYFNNTLANAIDNSGEMFNTFTKKYNDSLVYQCTGARAYYFECTDNKNTNSVKIEAYLSGAWAVLKTIDLSTADGSFAVYKGLIEYTTAQQEAEGFSAEETEVKITFGGVYPYFIKNVALYTELLGASANDIPPYTAYVEVDLTPATNFLGLTDEVSNKYGQKYAADTDYIVENNKILIPYYKKGEYLITYNKRPTPLTIEDLEVKPQSILTLTKT